jgi:hypothetical protein
MSNDPSSGGEQQPGWHGQQPYPGGYGQQPEQPAYGSYPQQPGQPAAGYGQATPSWQQTPGQQRYPGTAPGYPAGLSGMPPQHEQSFFGALFDFSFNSFATPVVIKVLYILGLVAIGLGYVVLVISGFANSPITGLAILIGGLIGALIYVIFLRITLEFYYAVVRMSEDIRAMRNRS